MVFDRSGPLLDVSYIICSGDYADSIPRYSRVVVSNLLEEFLNMIFLFVGGRLVFGK
jgi:hypothetical protein